MGEGEPVINGAEKPEPKKESSHTDHRDDFVASEGLTTAGAIRLRRLAAVPARPSTACMADRIQGLGPGRFDDVFQRYSLTCHLHVCRRRALHASRCTDRACLPAEAERLMLEWGKNELEEKRTPKWLVYLKHREWALLSPGFACLLSSGLLGRVLRIQSRCCAAAAALSARPGPPAG